MRGRPKKFSRYLRKAEAILRQRGAWFLFLPPTAPISIRSKWPSPNSRLTSAGPVPGPSTLYDTPSVTSAPYTPSKSAGISSSNMSPIKRSMPSRSPLERSNYDRAVSLLNDRNAPPTARDVDYCTNAYRGALVGR